MKKTMKKRAEKKGYYFLRLDSDTEPLVMCGGELTEEEARVVQVLANFVGAKLRTLKEEQEWLGVGPGDGHDTPEDMLTSWACAYKDGRRVLGKCTMAEFVFYVGEFYGRGGARAPRTELAPELPAAA